MKILRIDGGNVFFWSVALGAWRKIDEIDKGGLLSLLDLYLGSDVEMDAPGEQNLSNEVHKIIYVHLYEKLDALRENKSSFRDESERRYFDEISKYKTA